jgi:hypothetical protein
MLITFRTREYADITMFGDIALKLLRMMGHSGTVPSAIAAEDVPAALSQLRAGVAAAAPDDMPDDDYEGDPIDRPVGIAQRAYPLIQLLEHAAAAEKPVSWDR